MASLTAADILALTTNVAALVLSVVAIWLSVVFFKMSSSLSEGTKEAAKGIGASVDRLEKLFDKLYADTFSMMKDTVSDMRRHIWPEDSSDREALAAQVEQRAEEKLSDLRDDMERDLSRLLSRQMEQDERVASFRSLLERAISSGKEVASEAREETLRDQLVQLLSGKGSLEVSDMLVDFQGSLSQLADELERLKMENLVYWPSDGPPGLATEILINPRLGREHSGGRPSRSEAAGTRD